ncbi:MAG: CCA tRNA nucleotidyltransferase [Candidatus Coproplasma sp.]
MEKVTIDVPEKLEELARLLNSPLYIVGGICRDKLAGLKCEQRDWDICAPVSAELLSSSAEKCGFTISAIYKRTGTVRLLADNEEYEFTSFRTDKYEKGKHTPSSVEFTDDIVLDAQRRDFKCNAVYYDVLRKIFIDPLGGIADIEKRRLSTVVCASKVFGEDGLRLMRLCRISAQTDFMPTEECLSGAREHCELISDVAVERIWAELNAILHADVKYNKEGAQYKGLELLKESGVLKQILPELALGDKMEQRKDFHDYDVLEHSLRCVLYADKRVRLASLLHDVAKPYCLNNFGNFHKHEEYGAQIAMEICRRLRVPVALAQKACRLIELHMYDLSGATSTNKVRKFIVNNYEDIEELLLLKQADYSACKDKTNEAPCVSKWKKIMSDMKNEGVPFTLKELNVKGNELIEAGISPCETGKTLKFLLEQTAMGCVKNSTKELIAHALAKHFGSIS